MRCDYGEAFRFPFRNTECDERRSVSCHEVRFSSLDTPSSLFVECDESIICQFFLKVSDRMKGRRAFSYEGDETLRIFSVSILHTVSLARCGVFVNNVIVRGNKMRRLIIGDVHGSYRALMEVLEKASFASDDQLYFTGDAADGYMDVYECLSFFMEMGERFHPVIGNHDIWLQNWLLLEEAPYEWVSQGGRASILSFERACVSPSRRMEIGEFLLSWPYVISTEHEYICHGGPGDFASDDDMERLAALKRNPGYGCSLGEKIMWDRSYYVYADYDEKHDRSVKRFGKLSCSKRLFIGHSEIGTYEPLVSERYNLVNLDTGAGWAGCLTVMDMDTLEYWQSRKSKDLYREMR